MAANRENPGEKIRCLQVNTGRMRNSHDLVDTEVRKRRAKILIISESNKTLAKQKQWLVDEDALEVRNGQLTTGKQRRGKGFASMEVGTYRVYSCTISPNMEANLDNLENNVRGVQIKTKTSLGGDFNAMSFLWGLKQDQNREILTDWMSKHQFTVTNLSTTLTFVRGVQEAVLDLIVCPTRCAD